MRARQTPLRLAALSLLLLFAACNGSKRPTQEKAWPLDTLLGPGEVRCGPVTRESELIGGPGAYGQVGRSFRCHNSRIRFLVQDASRPVGNSARGGTLIDVDLVRGDEQSEGEDTFRELAVGFGVNEVEVESIEVVEDGREGIGVVRVSGRPAPVTIAPQAIFLRQELPARIQTDYILRPDVDYVEIKTTLFNETDDFIEGVIYGDFVTFGGATKAMTPEFGFSEPELFARATAVAAGYGEKTSYAYVCSEHDVILPAVYNTIAVPLCRDDAIVGLTDSYSRYLIVGDGSLESVLARAFELRGIETGRVAGIVRNVDGTPAAGVWVSALKGGGPNDPGATTTNQARTDEKGRYRLTLPPGEYRVVAHIEGKGRSDAAPVAVDVGDAVDIDLALKGSGRLVVDTGFFGAGGESLGRLPAKLSVVPLEGAQRPSGILGEFDRGGLITYVPSADGRFDVELPPGRYRIYVTRGFEFTRFKAEIDVAEGETTHVGAFVSHVVDTTGLVGAEFHQHSLGSVDASVPVPVKVLENAAEGVEFAASTDHDNVVDFRPHVEALGLSEHLVCVPGNEVSYQGIGHFNVYPWNIDPDDPFRDVGSRLWWQKTLPELFDDVRARAGDPIVQMNHPRSQGAGVFAAMGLDPTTATRIPRAPPSIPTLPPAVYDEWYPHFEAIEVNGSLGSPELFTDEGQALLHELAQTDATEVPVLADYFALLGAGMKVSAMGNSDSHHPNSGVGYPRNFLRVEKDDPSEVTPDDVRAAIRGQRVAVGSGCLVELFVGEARPMGKDEAIFEAQRDQVRVRLQAPPFVEVDGLELYVNGRAQPLRIEGGEILLGGDAGLRAQVPDRTTGAVLLDAPIRGLPEGDLAIIALARGGGGLAPTGSGGVFCYSAPLYVDDGGDGWRGWLEDTETVSGRP